MAQRNKSKSRTERGKAKPAKIGADKTKRKGAKRIEPPIRKETDLLERVSDGFIACDAGMNYVYVNRRGAELLGRKPEDMIGRNFLTEFPEAKGSPFANAYAEALKTQKPIVFEGYYAPWDRWFENRIYPSKDGLSIFFTEITGRKRAEDKLLGRETLLGLILDTSPAVIFVKDRDSTILEANRRMADFYNLSVTEIIGRRQSDLHRDLGARQEDVVQWLADDREVIDTGKIKHMIENGVDTNNQMHWFETTKYPIEIGGDRKGVLVFSEDITERKRAEEKIVFQAKLLDAVSNAVIATDPKGRVIYWNPAAEKLYGWTASEALGRNIIDLIPTEQSREQAMEIMEELISGRSWSGEFLVQRKDGSSFPAFVSDSSVLDDDGNLTGIIGVSKDITERKQAEHALRKSEELYRKLAENFPNGTVNIYDRDLRMTFVAGGDMKKYNATPDMFIGKTFQQLAPAETFAIAGPYLRAAFEGQVGTYETPYWEDRYYLVNVAPIVDPDGSINEIMVVTQNFTERVKDRENLEEAHKQLRSLTARLNEVEENERRSIAHELHDRLGQTLSALNINLNIMREQISGESARRVGSRIEDSVHLVEEAVMHMRNVMADLHPPVLDDYGLAAALRWYADRFSKRTEIPVRVEEAWETGTRLSPRLETVLFRIAQEALTNAALHAGARQVIIRLESHEQIHRMKVEDDGHGFDPAATKEPGSLSGWGLQIMRERIESVGGSFRLDSAPGHGTRIVAEINPETTVPK